MNNSAEKRRRNQEIIAKFLVSKDIEPQYKIPIFAEQFGCVYCIENKINGKKYIGATYAKWIRDTCEPTIRQIRQRASDYIYEYNKAIEGTTSSSKTLRPIIKAMFEEGIDNFIMYPLAETVKENHNKVEQYFIDLYKTKDPNYGYNLIKAGNSVQKVIRRASASYKRVRSDPIICINLNEKKIIFSEAMKLFGDYMNSTKDMIKNANRGASSYKGWFIFYIDKEKRETILNMYNNNEIDPRKKISNKKLAFYNGLYNSVSQYIDKNNNEYFSDFEILPKLIYTD